MSLHEQHYTKAIVLMDSLRPISNSDELQHLAQSGFKGAPRLYH